MNAPGKGMLKVVSILFIIFGAISTIVSLIAVLGSAWLSSMTGGLAGVLVVSTILLLIVSVLELIIGILGLGKCGDPTKAGFFIVTGIVLCAFAFLSLILSIVGGGFQFTGLIGFVLPILFIVGGVQNKNAASSSVAS